MGIMDILVSLPFYSVQEESLNLFRYANVGAFERKREKNKRRRRRRYEDEIIMMWCDIHNIVNISI